MPRGVGRRRSFYSIVAVPTMDFDGVDGTDGRMGGAFCLSDIAK